MKKKFMLGLALCAALAVTGCSQTSETAETTAAETTAAAEETTAAETAAEESEETSEEAEATEAETAEEAAEAEVMTYEEYMAADLDTQVTVATYVQAKQSRPPFTLRTRMEPTSCTTWPVPRRTMKSWFPEPRLS